jgi:hypothetical protein
MISPLDLSVGGARVADSATQTAAGVWYKRGPRLSLLTGVELIILSSGRRKRRDSEPPKEGVGALETTN